MPVQQHALAGPETDRLTAAAAVLGYEIVDIEGFLNLVEEHARAQREGLAVVKSSAGAITAANTDVLDAAKTLTEHTVRTVADVDASADLVRGTVDKTRSVASWVKDVSEKTIAVGDAVTAVRSNNHQIASISMQVNTLAINAKIEAARAGEAGRGFAVVAEAINDLSRKTKDAAAQISENIETLTLWIAALSKEAASVSEQATDVLHASAGTDDALSRVDQSIASVDLQAKRIVEQAQRVETSMAEFAPVLSTIESAVEGTTSGIEQTHGRILRLIDTSESIVQSTALLSTTSEDAKFIKAVQRLAADVSHGLDAAVQSGRITLSSIFDRSYKPIPGTDPEQFMTEATVLMDEILPPFQEPALLLDPRIVFCAAVDVNGYLPTHNKKFSHAPSGDPGWDAANCRNRRIFADRVGLKAGRSTQPFLLQVYRRDMGAGAFKMMKDLSAPITVQGRHWGALRLAYCFD